MGPGRIAGAILCAALLPAGASVSQSQTLAALCREDHKVRFFDGKTGKILAEEAVGETAMSMALPRGGLRLFVAEDGKPGERDSVLRVLSIITGHLETTMMLTDCRGPMGLGEGPQGRLLVPCSESETVLEVSGVDGGLHHRLRVGKGAVAAVYHAETDTTAIANRSPGELMLYDMEDRKIAWRHAAGKVPLALVQGYGETMLVLLDGERGTVQVLAPEAQTLGPAIAVGAGARSLVFAGEGASLLVTVAGAQGLALVDVEEGAVQRTMELGPGTVGLAVNSEGTRAWVSLQEANLVAMVDIEGWRVEATFPLAGGPGPLVYIKD